MENIRLVIIISIANFSIYLLQILPVFLLFRWVLVFSMRNKANRVTRVNTIKTVTESCLTDQQ